MDCFNKSCAFRVSQTSNPYQCSCVACPNRMLEFVTNASEDGVTRKGSYTGNATGGMRESFGAQTMINLAAVVLGVSGDRLRELAEADKDGRVVVLTRAEAEAALEAERDG